MDSPIPSPGEMLIPGRAEGAGITLIRWDLGGHRRRGGIQLFPSALPPKQGDVPRFLSLRFPVCKR